MAGQQLLVGRITWVFFEESVVFQDHITNRSTKLMGPWPIALPDLKEFQGGIAVLVGPETASQWGIERPIIEVICETVQLAMVTRKMGASGGHMSKAIHRLYLKAGPAGSTEAFGARIAQTPPETMVRHMFTAGSLGRAQAQQVAAIAANLFGEAYKEFCDAFPGLLSPHRFHIASHCRKPWIKAMLDQPAAAAAAAAADDEGRSPKRAKTDADAADAAAAGSMAGPLRLCTEAPYEAAHWALTNTSRAFEAVDALATGALKLPRDSDERIRRHGVESVKNALCQQRRHTKAERSYEGHVMAPIEPAAVQTAERLARDVDRGRVFDVLRKSWGMVAGIPPAEPKLMASEWNASFDLGRDWPVVASSDQNWVYPGPHRAAEDALIALVKGDGSPKEVFDATQPDDLLPGHTLDPLQQQAIKNAMTEPISVLTGPPGTGKTDTVERIIRRAIKAGHVVVAVAPTGRAAQRMQELLFDEERRSNAGMTIKQLTEGMFLGKPSTMHSAVLSKHIYTKQALPGDRPAIAVVDEASMVGIQAIGALLHRFGPYIKRWVLVGDACQLPSVSPGRVLYDLVTSGAVPTTVLKTVYRTQADGKAICDNAQVVREAIMGATKLDLSHVAYTERMALEPGVFEITDRNLSVSDLAALAVAFYGEHRNNFRAAQVMCQQNDICDAVNRTVRDAVNPSDASKTRLRWSRDDKEQEFRAGDRVIFVKNQHVENADGKNELVVSNGEMGIIRSVGMDVLSKKTPGYSGAASEESVAVDMDAGHKLVVSSSLFKRREVRHGYAITVHKSQGCEWNHVLLHVLSRFSPLNRAHLVYTGFTRARKSVKIAAARVAVDAALSMRNTVIDRRSQFVERLQGKWD